VIAKESYRKLRKSSTFAIRQAAARLSPSGGTTFQTTFSPLSFGESFMKIRSAVPENGCLSKSSTFARRQHDFRQAAARRFKLHFPPIVW